MPTNWNYTAKIMGKQVRGMVMAETEAEARTRLLDMGIEVQEVFMEGKPNPNQAGGLAPSLPPILSGTPQEVPPTQESQARIEQSIEAMKNTSEVAHSVAPKELRSAPAKARVDGKRRQSILLDEFPQVRAQAEELLSSLNGVVAHARMCVDAKGKIKILLVVEHDVKAG